MGISQQFSRAGLLRIVWAVIWAGLVGFVLQWVRPGVYLTVWRGFGPRGRFHDYLEYVLQAAMAIPALALLVLCWDLLRHWRMRYALPSPLRITQAHIVRLVVAKMGGEHGRALLLNAAFLGRLTILAGWSFDDLMRQAQRCRSQTFSAGTQVLREGEPNLWFYLFFDGAFEVRERMKRCAACIRETTSAKSACSNKAPPRPT